MSLSRQLVDDRYEYALTREDVLAARRSVRDIDRFAVPGAHRRPPRDQVGD